MLGSKRTAVRSIAAVWYNKYKKLVISIGNCVDLSILPQRFLKAQVKRDGEESTTPYQFCNVHIKIKNGNTEVLKRKKTKSFPWPGSKTYENIENLIASFWNGKILGLCVEEITSVYNLIGH